MSSLFLFRQILMNHLNLSLNEDIFRILFLFLLLIKGLFFFKISARTETQSSSQFQNWPMISKWFFNWAAEQKTKSYCSQHWRRCVKWAEVIVIGLEGLHKCFIKILIVFHIQSLHVNILEANKLNNVDLVCVLSFFVVLLSVIVLIFNYLFLKGINKSFSKCCQVCTLLFGLVDFDCK